ncbi:hypothetical protein BC940DRAFT_329675 [Gongronella butleri]|nr:hypothetical protein BC940DRAFT_329675 [Gongronella butleri]
MPTAILTTFTVTRTIQGKIRHKRKLSKELFFIDVALSDEDRKVQVQIRCDDGSMDRYDHKECHRMCHLGDVIELDVGELLDDGEREKAAERPYEVFQAVSLPRILVPFDADDDHYLGDPPLDFQGRTTIVQWDGKCIEKKDVVCKYWISQRNCRRSDACIFRHPDGEDFAREKQLWHAERKAAREHVNKDANDPHASKQPHALRAMIYARWLSEKFPDAGTTLDVGGGKGELALFLTRAFGKETIVVEPKVRKQTKAWQSRFQRMLAKFHPEGCENPAPWPEFMHTMLDDAFVAQQTELLARVTLFVGLHPDEATEPIVDQALRLGKPFAVIPCCVFASKFRHRRLRSGLPVDTTEDLIQYLTEKDTGEFGGTIRTAYLNIEGKNQIVYWIPGKA